MCDFEVNLQKVFLPPPPPTIIIKQKNLYHNSLDDAYVHDNDLDPRVKNSEIKVKNKHQISFYTKIRPILKRQFVFIIGAEGTGSTWLSLIIPADHRPAVSIKKGITAVIHQLWADGPLFQVRLAKTGMTNALKAFIPKDRYLSVLHVSAPDWDSLHYPDLHSSLWPMFYEANLTLRIIIIHRDASKAAYSNYRRNWAHLRLKNRADLARSARSTEKHMSLLASQLESLPYTESDVLVVKYEKLLSEPVYQAKRLAIYLNLNTKNSLELQMRLRRNSYVASDYKKRLNKDDVLYLTQFFDIERKRKWKSLIELSTANS